MSSSPPTGRFRRLLSGLSRTRQGFVSRLRALTGAGVHLDEDRIEEIEEMLLAADCGVAVADEACETLRKRARETRSGDGDPLAWLRSILLASFPDPPETPRGQPHVVLLVGVNGSGKTTTAGKLAYQAQARGERVILAAADTYRAAAVEQLQIWAERAGADLVRQREGADPAAVVVDALRAAAARHADLVLADTAGRLHTRPALMRELEKMGRVAGRESAGAPHEVLLVLDAGTGQNGLVQAQQFTAALPLTGLVLTKLDGTARGGVAMALARELHLPIRYVGVGESVDDLLDFSPQEFVDGLLAGAGTD